MSLPINNNNTGKTNITSNQIIWQGKNISCINICTGDTVSDVVYNLATQFCQLQELFNLQDYNFSCIGTPEPGNIKDLIQLLVNNLCNSTYVVGGEYFLTDEQANALEAAGYVLQII